MKNFIYTAKIGANLWLDGIYRASRKCGHIVVVLKGMRKRYDNNY